nr:hypothetical protein Itr_chr07CG00230 [Ipomoea trifida]
MKSKSLAHRDTKIRELEKKLSTLEKKATVAQPRSVKTSSGLTGNGFLPTGRQAMNQEVGAALAEPLDDDGLFVILGIYLTWSPILGPPHILTRPLRTQPHNSRDGGRNSSP